MFRFCSIFLASVYALMLKIFGFISVYVKRSKSCVAEENGSNFSTNRSQNSMVFLSSGLAEKELQKGKIDSNGSIAEREGSVFLQSGLISNSSKCQFMSGNNVSGYLEKPKTVKFVIQEMFVGSDDVLVNSDQSLDCGISERKDSLEQNLEKNQQEFCEESDTSLFHFKLFNASCFTNEDNQEHISDLENIGQNHTKFIHSEEDYDEKEKLNSVDSKDFRDSVEDEVLEDLESDKAFLEENDSENWMSNFLDKNDERKPEDLEEKHDIDIKNFLDLDEEYIEFEPISVNLTHIGKENIEESDKRDTMQTEEKTAVDSSQETKKFWDSDSDDDEDEQDVLWEHQHLVRQMKMELKNCRIKGLPTISEECETPKIAEDLKPLKFDRKIEYKDVMEEIQKFYKSYLEKMRKLDILNYQTLHAISFLQLKESEVFTAGKKKADSVNLILPKIWPRKGQRIYADTMHKSITEMHRDLEMVYVGQICLSWEILSWLYVKARELLEYDRKVNHSYNRAADEFQQFQVLVQRFVEDEQFQGQRIQNYVKSRCMIRSLLHVPTIKDDCLKDKKERKEETDAISLESLVEIIRESMLIFREFLFSDKNATKGVQGAKIDHHQDCENSKILLDVITNLQKKERRIREQMRSQNCIVKKLKKHQECGFGHELLTSQVELRLVSRVLSLSRLTTDQLVWCQMKLKNISFVRRKVHVEPSFLLFPC